MLTLTRSLLRLCYTLTVLALLAVASVVVAHAAPHAMNWKGAPRSNNVIDIRGERQVMLPYDMQHTIYLPDARMAFCPTTPTPAPTSAPTSMPGATVMPAEPAIPGSVCNDRAVELGACSSVGGMFHLGRAYLAHSANEDGRGATIEALDLLPSVGLVLAGRLYDYLASVNGVPTWEGVDSVKGVGVATLAKLQLVSDLR